MNQKWLIKNILKHQDSMPHTPGNERDYLTLEQAQEIVDETVDYLGRHGSEIEYTYVNGHRKRLAHSLSMIPKARKKGESCLDIGCYGYMLLWAKKHLGYERTVGIEWHPDNSDQVLERKLDLNGYSLSIQSHNFDISASRWPLDEQFDTVLFFEVLEHINHDPMGVMERLHEKLKLNGTLVMSVPNAISYKTLKEFLVGMPPWTYWFYEPDLSHEPRHCFEYTPLVFKALISSTGLTENAFRTIYAYTEPEHEVKTIEIARTMGYTEQELGETMIINATKTSQSISLRYPDVIYSPKGYYDNIYPLLEPKLHEVHQHFSLQIKDGNHQSNSSKNELLLTCEHQLQQIEELQSSVAQGKLDRQHARTKNSELNQQVITLESDIKQMFTSCDRYLQNETINARNLKKANDELRTAMTDAKNSRSWAESLAKENADMAGQINELLFACDCYLQQVNDPTRCIQVVREQRFRNILRTSKAVARKTPFLRTALRPVYRKTKKFIKRHVTRS